VLQKLLARLQSNPALAVLGLGSAAVVLLLASVVGALTLGGNDKPTANPTGNVVAGPAPTDSAGNTIPTTAPGQTVVTEPGGAPATTAKSGTTATTKAGSKSATTKPGSTTSPTLASAPGATRQGTTKDKVLWAVHAPTTFGNLPVNFAEDPLKGMDIYVRYINQKQGGINGRAIDPHVYNDKYEVDGAQTASNQMINELKPFFISGTLGVDQVALVAKDAKKAKIPYIAGGGSEALFKDIGMFQQASSYDTHLIQLAHFLAKESAKGACTAVPCADGTSLYSGRKKVAVSSLRTDYILNAVNVFKNELGKVGMQYVGVTTVSKPTDQTSYGTNIQELKGYGAEIVVPAQDPLTTSRIVAECQTQQCAWKWTISDFAHESDVALQLMQASKDPSNPSRPAWTNVRGLAGGCYYTIGGNSEKTPSLCGALGVAHTQWVTMADEADYTKDGQGGVAGYQLVHIWVKAMADAGSDLTREKFVDALNTYDNYADLVSGPISYKGSSNISHGATKMVVYEADTSAAWHQIGPGFVDGF
jgi:ABC-type branched-subunit amino acid transport system substrate-binding protein